MADPFAPVASGIIPPDPNQGMRSLSAILGIRQQRQDLETGQATQRSVQAKATIDTQGANENFNLAKLLADPIGNGIIDSDGNPTKGAQSVILRAAPTTGSEAYDKVVNAARSKIELNGAINGLKGNERKELVDNITGSAASPDSSYDDMKDNLTALVESKKGTPEYDSYKKIAEISTQGIDHLNKKEKDRGLVIPTGKEAWRGGAANLGRTILGAPGVVGAGGIAAPQAAQVDTGGQIQPGTTAPALAGGGFTPGGSPIAKVTPPTIMGSPGGSIVRVAPGGASMAPIPESAPASRPGQSAGKLQPLTRPGLNAPAADQANYKARIEAAGQEQQAVSQAANDPLNGVQSTRFRNQQILDLIPHADTGPGLKLLNTLASRLPGSSGDAYQDIEHYTAQNSAALAKLMGVPGTNLGAETAAAAAGSVEKNPKALAEITKTNDALNTAFDLYNRGFAKVTNNGSDLSRAAAYKQAFGANLDVNAIRWADAHRRKDTEEVNTLQGKSGSAGIAEYTRKLKALKSLAATGDLP